MSKIEELSADDGSLFAGFLVDGTENESNIDELSGGGARFCLVFEETDGTEKESKIDEDASDDTGFADDEATFFIGGAVKESKIEFASRDFTTCIAALLTLAAVDSAALDTSLSDCSFDKLSKICRDGISSPLL